MNMSELAASPSLQGLIELARAAALVGNYCDHAEHVEPLDGVWLSQAAELLWEFYLRSCRERGLHPCDAYSRRLEQIERRNILDDGRCAPARAAMRAVSPREMQLAQLQHDRHYHPDVLGLNKTEQLRHYAFHLSKLVGHLAEAVEAGQQLEQARMADTCLFAIKLNTLTGQRMSEQSWPEPSNS